MSKKKNKVAKITEEQYYAYIMGLRSHNGTPFTPDGEIIVPDAFTDDGEKEKEKPLGD